MAGQRRQGEPDHILGLGDFVYVTGASTILMGKSAGFLQRLPGSLFIIHLSGSAGAMPQRNGQNNLAI